MKTKELRFRVPEDLHVRYAVVCKELRLSMGKQIAVLVEQFVDVHDGNVDIKRRLRRKE